MMLSSYLPNFTFSGPGVALVNQGPPIASGKRISDSVQNAEVSFVDPGLKSRFSGLMGSVPPQVSTNSSLDHPQGVFPLLVGWALRVPI